MRCLLSDFVTTMTSSAFTMTAFLDNSNAFDRYLERHGLEAALQRSSLQRRQTHTIVPQARLSAGPLAGAR
jgi:hypothetical protein